MARDHGVRLDIRRAEVTEGMLVGFISQIGADVARHPSMFHIISLQTSPASHRHASTSSS